MTTLEQQAPQTLPGIPTIAGIYNTEDPELTPLTQEQILNLIRKQQADINDTFNKEK